MDPRDIPERSNFWFSQKSKGNLSGQLFDQASVLFSVILAVFSFLLFWPIVSQISIEEAFFTPLVPFLLYILGVAGLASQEAMRVLFICSFMVSTVGIYLFVKDLTKRQITAILASIIYLIPPVPVFVLTHFRQGLLEKELEAAKSFLIIVYGDGAHFIALALIPFAAIFSLRYLKSNSRVNLLFSVIFCSLIFLATRSQAMSLILILGSVALTEFFLGMARVKIKRLLQIVLLSLGVVSFWYTPSFLVESIMLYKGNLIENIKFLFPLSFILVGLALFFTFVFFAKNEKRQPIFVSFLLFVIYFTVIGDWMWHQRSFVPHVQRLIANLNMFGAIVLSIIITFLIDKQRLTARIGAATWSQAYRTFATLVFAITSFILVGFGAFSLSPLILLFVSGPNGIWSRIEGQVIADRQSILRLSKVNFGLISQGRDDWQFVGVIVSIVSLAVLLFIVFANLGKVAKSSIKDETE